MRGHVKGCMKVRGGRPWESEVGGHVRPMWEAVGVRGGRPKWEAEVGGRSGRPKWEAEVGGCARLKWEAMRGRVRPIWEAV